MCQLQRLAELCGDTYCNHIWSKWLTIQDAWLATSRRIGVDFTDFLSHLTSNGNSKREPVLIALAEGILNDCTSLRDELTPGLNQLLTIGTWAALRSSGEEMIPTTLRELGFDGDGDDEGEGDAEDQSVAKDKFDVCISKLLFYLYCCGWTFYFYLRWWTSRMQMSVSSQLLKAPDFLCRM